MSQVDFSATSSVSFGELGPTTSLQLMFAKLQLELAETAKTQATDKMDAIAKAQEEQKFVSQLLNEARQAQADGNSGTGVGMTSINGVTVTGKDCYPMSQEMVDYMDAHKLAYPNGDGDYILGKDEVNYKKLLFTVQSTLAMRWVETRDAIAPSLFSELVSELVTDESLLAEIDGLVRIKSESDNVEGSKRLFPNLLRFIEDSFSETQPPFAEDILISDAPFNRFLLRVLDLPA